MKVLAITQARTGSSRLPNKVLKTVNGKTLLQIHLSRILASKKIDQLLVATTIETNDNVIESIATQLKLPVYRGSVNDVLDRFYQAARPYQPEWVVRLTSDCPLIDAVMIDQVIETALKEDVDYCSNTLNPTFPDGMDIEVFKFSALEKAWKEAVTTSDREHVTPYIHQNSSFYNKPLFRAVNFTNDINYEGVRLTVDEPKDFEVIRLIIEKAGIGQGWKAYADLYLSDEQIKSMNAHIERNEGYKKSLNN